MKKYLRLRELADYMGVSKRTVRNWCRNGLTKYRVPGSNVVYFDSADLQKFFVAVNERQEEAKINVQIADILRKMEKEGN